MTQFEKLKKKLKSELDYDLVDFERCYPGYWQRAAGAWSWRCKEVDEEGRRSAYDFGSQFSVGEILKAKSISIYKREIIVND